MDGVVGGFIPLAQSWRTIVGVVGDTRDAGLERDPTPAVYEPLAQGGVFTAAMLVRTTPDPRALQHSIVQYIHDARRSKSSTTSRRSRRFATRPSFRVD